MSELRLYSFVNFYLSSIQQGIQTGHMAVNLVMKYSDERMGCDDAYIMAHEWAIDHKTFIVLNGGDSDSIQLIALKLWRLGEKLKLPFDSFVELGCADMITCVGIVVPEEYFKAERHDDGWMYYFDSGGQFYEAGSPESELINLFKSYQLARQIWPYHLIL